MEIRRLKRADEQAFFKEQEAYVAERAINPDLEPFGLVTDFSAFIDDLRAEEEGLTDRPRTTCYYGFIDGEIVGHINCRWDLTPDLEAFGGHIGYMVVAKYRRQGVASQLLAYALGQYAGAGYERILLTARVTNQASRATIEKAGGRLEDERTDDKGQTFARYWIELGGKNGD